MEHTLCEAVQDIPREAAHRHWTLRADNDSHYHGIVSLSESPLYLELNWRPSAGDAVRPVGVFRLDLDGLLRDGYIRHEPAGSTVLMFESESFGTTMAVSMCRPIEMDRDSRWPAVDHRESRILALQ